MELLHGVLEVVVYEAKNLPTTLRLRATGCLKTLVCCGMGPELTGSVDPYVVMELGVARRLRSRFIKNKPRDVVWQEKHEVYVADMTDQIKFVVKDADVVGSDHLGEAALPVARIKAGEMVDVWLPLVDPNGNPVGHVHKTKGKQMEQGQLHISIQYKAVESAEDVRMGLKLVEGQRYGEVPRTYFPLRIGNDVRQYHDAWQKPGPVPDVLLSDGKPFVERACWDDIYESIVAAKRFVFITGWSVWVETRLKRKPRSDVDSPTLGELLIAKANAGISVLLLVWDDKTNNMGLTSGVMATHDQETYQFFRNTKVHCILCPREGGVEDSLLQGLARGNFFTHHQKSVMVDGEPLQGDSRRPTVAYVGGIDLCDGRYDWHEHSLFATTAPGGPHEKDFHQPCIPGWDPNLGGPREPWHDIHSRLEGPVALDVLLNFIERWTKQAGAAHQHALHELGDMPDLHLPEAAMAFLRKSQYAKGRALGRGISLKNDVIKSPQMQELRVTDPNSPDSWAVQLFRSIDSDSADGFPSTDEPHECFNTGLAYGKGKVVDASIHRAYVTAIRRAQRFIYIENQYFLGSCHLWDQDNDVGALHLIPAELMLKIVSKIKAKEPFCCYVVLPLFPEGIATSGSVQAILHFQTCTMRMMYKHIAEALAEYGNTDASVSDYLQFYCLGNREAAPQEITPEVTPVAPENANGQAANGEATQNGNTSQKDTIQTKANAARRFMVYVHSKMMIVDDEYIIIGSANINQRSMDGSRDTELAIGAFQQGHTLQGAGASTKLPRGQVAGFRTSLWKEHTGELLAGFEDPSSVECARTLRAVGNRNWLLFSRDQPVDMTSHLMTYPVTVSPAGDVGPLYGAEEFPDLGGNIVGTKINTLPAALTT